MANTGSIQDNYENHCDENGLDRDVFTFWDYSEMMAD